METYLGYKIQLDVDRIEANATFEGKPWRVLTGTGETIEQAMEDVKEKINQAEQTDGLTP